MSNTSVSVDVPYGNEETSLNLDKGRLAFVLEPAEAPAIENLEMEIRGALNNPIGVPTISDTVGEGDSVAILVDDNTRITPVRIILPPVLSEIQRIGIQKDRIKIIIASGTHRKMSNEELIDKLGPEIFETYALEQHDYKDLRRLTKIGEVEGVPIKVNSSATEADFLIGIGNIIPHCDFGFSGGSKIVQPGICSYAATALTHILCQSGDEIPLGQVDNPARVKAEKIAAQAGLKFVLNVILNRFNEVVAVRAGDPIKAQRAGVEISKSIYGARFPQRADIVVVSAFPADKDYWQAAKGLAAGYFACKKNGIIILTSPCSEGVADEVHSRFLDYWCSMSYDEIKKVTSNADYENEELDLIAAGGALMQARIREHATLILVSEGISENDAGKLGFLKSSTLQGAAEFALRRYPKGSVGIIKMGGATLPIEEGRLQN